MREFFKGWKRKLGVVTLALACCGILCAVFALRFVDKEYRDHGLMVIIARRVVRHLEANDSKWPQSWDDLRDDYSESEPSNLSFAELSDSVNVDWNFNPKHFVDSARPLTLRSGSSGRWHGRDPNEIVATYLRNKRD